MENRRPVIRIMIKFDNSTMFGYLAMLNHAHGQQKAELVAQIITTRNFIVF
jgi:hypothetical protein